MNVGVMSQDYPPVNLIFGMHLIRMLDDACSLRLPSQVGCGVTKISNHFNAPY